MKSLNSLFLNIFFIGFLTIFLFGCGKKNNTRLADTYYKMAMLEISENEESIGVYKKSLVLIDKALKEENKPEYLAFKATLLLKINREREGGILFDKAIKECSDPKLEAEILNNKACLLAQVGIKKGIKKYLEESMRIWRKLERNKYYMTPEVALFNQSKVFVFEKRLEQAKNKLIESVSIEPSFVDACFYLALVSYDLKDFDLAKRETTKVLFLSPDHKGAIELKSALQNL